MNYRQARTHVKHGQPIDDTKSTIIRTALHLFAERGLEGVSLSELRLASGQHNRSAIHYHFGNKDGLLDAVTDLLCDSLEKPMRESVNEGWRQSSAGELTLERFVRVLNQPFLTLYKQGEEGRDCIRMLSHFSHETVEKQQARAFTPLQDYMGNMARLLHTLLPRFSPHQLGPLLFLGTCTVMESLMCSGMLMREHSLDGEAAEAPDESAFMELALQFAQGGLLAAARTMEMSLR